MFTKKNFGICDSNWKICIVHINVMEYSAKYVRHNINK